MRALGYFATLRTEHALEIEDDDENDLRGALAIRHMPLAIGYWSFAKRPIREALSLACDPG
jgi:hypothetical protein